MHMALPSHSLEHILEGDLGILEPLEAELAGDLFAKARVGVAWSDGTSQSDVWCLPRLRLGTLSSIRREKKGDPGEAMALQKHSLAECWLQLSAVATSTRNGCHQHLLGHLRALMWCQDPPWCSCLQ